MKFSRDYLQDLVYETPISDVIVEHNRWSVTHERIFKHEGRFFKTRYSVAATEGQDESPYEYEPDEIECPEVFPVERTITVYEEQ